jgi:hypothetical protein
LIMSRLESKGKDVKFAPVAFDKDHHQVCIYPFEGKHGTTHTPYQPLG